MDFIFDVETTGLPRIGDPMIQPSERYKDMLGFSHARLLSISWIVVHNGTPIEQAYYIVKPTDFVINEQSIRIHGITREIAMHEGVDRNFVFQKLESTLQKCDTLVAHNIKFDVSILSSELFRYGKSELLEAVLSKRRVCTMTKGKGVMASKKNPKLGELYKFLYNEEITNAHDAQYDTLHCYKCYVKMFPREKNVFYFDSKQVYLTDEQEKIVYEELDKNIVVTACAGSGKSSTMLCRVKYLLENKVDDSSIIMTTFTKDAANDMTTKMASILGYTSQIKIGTIDGIARSIVEEEVNHHQNTGVITRKRSTMIQHVGEYAPQLLDFIKKCGPSFFNKYSYMFVDEFQDINDIQYDIIHTFYKNGVKIFAVGDAAQNIYTFRGSNVSYMRDFEKNFNNSVRHTLTRNFRCSTPIVNFAKAILPATKMISTMHTHTSKKPRVRYFSYQHEQIEFLIKRIGVLLQSGNYKEHDIAILSPMNKSLYAIEEALLKKGIRNVVLDGNNNMRHSIVEDHVCLATIHKSKGLEWACVFVIDISDALFPRSKNNESVDEDRRLFYVAVTRAKELLFMLYRASRNEPYVTRYIQDIDPCLYIFKDYNPLYTSNFSTFDMTNGTAAVSKTNNSFTYLDGDTLTYFKNVFLGDLLVNGSSAFVEECGVYIGYAKITDYPESIKKERLYNEYGECIFQLVYRSIYRLFKLHPLLSSSVRKILYAFIIDDTSFPNSLYMYNSVIKALREQVMVNDNKSKLLQLRPKDDRDKKRVFDNLLAYYEVLFGDNIVNNIHDFHVLHKNELPRGFDIQKLKESIQRLEDCHHSYLGNHNVTLQIKNDIWTLTKCKSLLIDRKRIFYVDESNINVDLVVSDVLCANIDAFLDYIKKVSYTNNEDITVELFDFKDMQYIIVGNTMIDIQVTLQSNVQLEWLFKSMASCCIYNSKHQYQINNIVIYNILQGKYHVIDSLLSWKAYKSCAQWLMDRV